ncbi:MAG TPA: alpha/beta fold hydrolase [Chloroflexota bacterium]|nr:alpha/beta fold hydrolase [Chloroflexota bacterium]
MEERFFFENEGAHVYAVLHTPPADMPARQEGVVLCHPLLDFDLYEVPWTIRMIVGYARELARLGYPALRFDFRGAGLSDGEFEQLTLSSCVSDLQRAVDVLVERTGVTEVVLIGWRLGATVAMRVGARNPRVRRLVLWDPVPDPHGSLQAVFRRVRASLVAMGRSPDSLPGLGPPVGDAPGGTWGLLQPNQNRLDAGGYVIGPAFLEEIKSWDSSADVRAFRGRVLILQLIRGWSGGAGLRRALVQLDEAYRAAGAESQLLEVMDVHPAEWFKQPDYSRVFEATSAWLTEGAGVR